MIAATILLFASALAPAPVCHPAEKESILGSDLATADSRFSALPGEASLGYAPAPGARRIFRGAELSRIAARYGLPEASFTDLCFERTLQPVNRELLMKALQKSLAIPDARIEIAEASRYPAPLGDIVFPRSGLGSPMNGTALWKGYVSYGASRRFPIWARVSIQVREARVIAVEALPPGVAIESSKLRLETAEGFPSAEAPAQSLDQVSGRAPRRRVRAGSAIPLSALEEAKEVSRGDRVQVEARAGSALIAMDGRAESGGRSGETISVLNLKSGKRFPAQVSGKGKVLVSQ